MYIYNYYSVWELVSNDFDVSLCLAQKENCHKFFFDNFLFDRKLHHDDLLNLQYMFMCDIQLHYDGPRRPRVVAHQACVGLCVRPACFRRRLCGCEAAPHVLLRRVCTTGICLHLLLRCRMSPPPPSREVHQPASTGRTRAGVAKHRRRH